MDRIKVILAGAGFMGKAHAKAYQQMDSAQVVAVVDPMEPGKQLARELGVECIGSLPEALEQTDADMVDVCVPTFLHEEYVIPALAAGKAVLCEKPFALNGESARRMRDASREAGVPLMVAQPLRFWPEYVKLIEAWRGGELGEPIMTTAVRLSQPPAWAEWYQDPKLSGGGALDLHAHDVDMMVHIHGRVREVTAVGYKNDLGAWNHVISTLRFENGRVAVAEGGLEMSPGYPFTMGLRMVGTQATIEYLFKAGANLDETVENDPTLWKYCEEAAAEALEFEEADPYAAEIAYFVDCLQHAKPTDMVPIDESVHVLDVLMAIQRALESGGTEQP